MSATALRLYVRVFIIWLAIAYLWLVICLWVRPGLFALGAFVAAMCYLGTLDIANPDDNVVRFGNLSRAAVRELYFPYLDSLIGMTPSRPWWTGQLPTRRQPSARGTDQ